MSELLAYAASFMVGDDRKLGANRTVAAALLLRQALEAALDDLWAKVAPGLEDCSARAQLVSLPFFLADDQLTGDVVSAWHRLSRDCHHDEYDLPPATADIEHLAGIVARLETAVANRTPSTSS